MTMMEKLNSLAPKVFVISGPSGVGKGTLCKLLIDTLPHLALSISMTTRTPRTGEQDGVDYFFTSVEAFEALIESHGFLEWARYNHQYYGTPLVSVEKSLKAGQSVLLEIDIQGALQVKKSFPDACLIFIAPPCLEALEDRIRSRGLNTEADIQGRLAIAEKELAFQEQFDHTFINDSLEACYQQVALLIHQKTLECV